MGVGGGRPSVQPSAVIAEVTRLKSNIPLAERTTLCYGDFHWRNLLVGDGELQLPWIEKR